MRIFFIAIVWVGLASIPLGTALGHGPHIQITADSGKIITRELLPTIPFGDSLSDPKKVYAIPLREYLGAWYTRPNNTIDPVLNIPTWYSGPGVAYGYGYDSSNPTDVDFEPGSTLRIEFTAGLKRWDGAAFVDAGSTEMEVFRGQFSSPSSVAGSSDTAPFTGVNYATVDYSVEGTDVHNTTRFRLLGDGVSPTSASLDGVYLLSLQLRSTQAGLEPSDPFYFVMSKNAPGEVAAAINSLGVNPELVQFVPEPSGLALSAVALVGCLRLCRRSRRG